VVDGGGTGPRTGDSVSGRAPLKQRRASAGQGSGRARQRAAAASAASQASAASAASGPSAVPDATARPPLPKRQPRASYIPRPLDDTAPPGTGVSHASATLIAGSGPPAEQLTGLMASFLGGVSRSENEEEDNDSPAGD